MSVRPLHRSLNARADDTSAGLLAVTAPFVKAALSFGSALRFVESSIRTVPSGAELIARAAASCTLFSAARSRVCAAFAACACGDEAGGSSPSLTPQPVSAASASAATAQAAGERLLTPRTVTLRGWRDGSASGVPCPGPASPSRTT